MFSLKSQMYWAPGLNAVWQSADNWRQIPVEVEAQMYHLPFFIEDIYHSFTNFKFKEDWVVGEEKDLRRKAGKQSN